MFSLLVTKKSYCSSLLLPQFLDYYFYVSLAMLLTIIPHDILTDGEFQIDEILKEALFEYKMIFIGRKL